MKIDIDLVRKRSTYIEAIRTFFLENKYLEVDTPVLSEGIIPEATIELFKTTRHGYQKGADQTFFLLPSPEIYMKKLLAAGSGSIFQFSRCFRDFEEVSDYHQPEFLMLEWYSVGSDYKNSIEFTEELLFFITKDHTSPISGPFQRMTLADAFLEYADIDLLDYQDSESFRLEAERRGLQVGGNWSDIYNGLFISLVEPKLPKDQPLFLIDYPEQVSCLAAKKTGTPWRERWELYLGGVEVANCYTEETSFDEVLRYFQGEEQTMLREGRDDRIDADFPEIYRRGHERCSGTALGIDRLMMVLLGEKSIKEIVPFPQEYQS